MSAEKVVVHYLPIRARAEPIKLLLTYAGEPFEVDTFSYDDMKVRCQESPNKRSPWIDFKGKKLAEGFAILRFFGRKHGLAGRNDWEAAEIDMIADMFKDFKIKLVPFFGRLNGMGTGDLDEMKSSILRANFRQDLPNFENFIKNSGNGFVHPSGLSWADFLIASWAFTFDTVDEEFAQTYPVLMEHQKRIHELPKVKEYVQSRPAASF